MVFDVCIVPERTPVEFGDANLVDEVTVVGVEVRECDGVPLGGVTKPDHGGRLFEKNLI